MWQGTKGTLMTTTDDCGPCGCSHGRSTQSLEIPLSWHKEEKEQYQQFLSDHEFLHFARGYDYARILSTSGNDDDMIGSCCYECGEKAIALGLVIEEDNWTLT